MSYASSLKFIIILVLLLPTGAESHSADGITHLSNGLKAYQETADFDKAISEFQEAIRLGLDNRADLIKAHLYLGFAYIGKGQRMAAQVEFAKAIKLEPALSLDPKLHSSKIVTVFNDTKYGLVDTITVVSVPGGAEVYLDDKSMGITPLRLNDVLVGEHALMVVKKYYQPKSLEIQVRKGEDNRFPVQLDKREVEILLTSQPTDAAVYVDGKEGAETQLYGKTPLSLKMFLDQELTIKLAKEEFLDKELKLKLTEAGISVSGSASSEDSAGNVHVELNPAPPPGSLRIASDPSGATVYLDGIAVGETPMVIAKVMPGVRGLRISAPGFASETKKVEVISNKETAVDIALGGELHILSIPTSAQIFINEKYTGITPLKTGRIPAGSYQIRLVKDKHKDKLSTVVVERGQVKEVNMRLSPLKGSVAVSSDPPGAYVYLDGEIKGNTPIFLYGVTTGQHSLKLVKEAYENWERQIAVEELKISWCFGKLKNKTS